MINASTPAPIATKDRAETGKGRSRIGIFYPADPVGHIPGGIDTIIRGILKWAPTDLEYTLYGATSDLVARPVNKEISVPMGKRAISYEPLVAADPSSTRGVIPLTVRFMWALRRYLRQGHLRHLDILDFHRIETLALFWGDPRPKNIMIHQDMEVIRSKDSDIAWRHAPWLYEIIESRLIQLATHVFCVRKSAVDRYRRLHAAIADRFSFLPTWVDTTVFHPLQTDQIRQDQRQRIADRLGFSAALQLLVWVGRLDRQKDPLLLLDAIKGVVETQPNLHLLMVGDGNMRAQVESRIHTLELQNHISLLGAIPPEQIAELLQIADLSVLSSAYEGMPIVVLEALATGVPVVTTEVGEVRLVVRDGINGFVVADRSAESFANSISEALSLGASIRGPVCEQSIADYVPQRVLRGIYDNHRRQTQQTNN